MLSRIDIERQALGMPLIKPMDNYREPIEGYEPDDDLIDFGDRPSNMKLRDLEYRKIEDMEKARKAIETIIKDGKFRNNKPITADVLATTIESNATLLIEIIMVLYTHRFTF